MGDDVMISIKNLNKKYGKTVALNGLCAEINENEIIGLIGANGSGKTTLMKILAGLEFSDSGEVSVCGKNPGKASEVRKEIIFSSFQMNISRDMQVKEILRSHEIYFEKFDMAFAKKALEIFGINEKSLYSKLSLGMKSLVNFVVAIADRCKLTMLDEPFNGIDIENRAAAYQILLRDYMENPRTFIISSHNLAELEGIFSEMLLIDEGKEVLYKSMDDVREYLLEVTGEDLAISDFRLFAGDSEIKEVNGELGKKVIVKNRPEVREKAEAEGLNISAVSPEDLAVYLTGKSKEDKINDLWEG